jgi:CysZ protein
MIINLIIYGSIFIFSYNRLTEWIEKISRASLPGAGFWSIFLEVILFILGFIVLLIICYFLFTILGGLITAPFNENISQIVEEEITNEKIITGIGFWKDTCLSVRGEVQKLIFYFSLLFVIFLLNFVPLIGEAVSLVLGILLSCFFNALDFLDYPMQRKLFTFKQKLKVTLRGRMLTFGFGAIAFLMMFLPIVNVFMKPILVVAGTSLYHKKNYTKLFNPLCKTP